MKVLLLNPPGTRRYLRDYYCSHISKGRYVWHPIDLLVLSGHLAGVHDVLVCDAIAESKSAREVNRLVSAYEPDAVFFLTGSVSWMEDRQFIADLPLKKSCILCSLGDSVLFEPTLTFSLFPRIDAVLFDFVSAAVLSVLSGDKGGSGFVRRFDRDRSAFEPFPVGRIFRFPLPQYGLFPEKRYHLAHLHYHPFASVLTDFGCPFRCTFCPYESLPYKIRESANVFEEFDELASRGIREVWFKDQSFGSNRRHTLEIVHGMIDRAYRFSWSCETRAEYCDRDTLSLWRRAGCHTVMIGVESSDPSIRQQYGKPVTELTIQRALAACRAVGIRSLVHFIVGLPGETTQSLSRLPCYASSLDCDFATFNIATPEYGTSFRRQALGEGWIDDGLRNLDSSCSYPILRSPGLSPEFLWSIRNESLRRFYFRFSQAFRFLQGTRTWYQWQNLIRESGSLALDIVRGLKNPGGSEFESK